MEPKHIFGRKPGNAEPAIVEPELPPMRLRGQPRPKPLDELTRETRQTALMTAAAVGLSATVAFFLPTWGEDGEAVASKPNAAAELSVAVTEGTPAQAKEALDKFVKENQPQVVKKVEPKPEEKPADRTLIIEYSEWPSEAELELHVVRSCHHEVSCMAKQRDGIKLLKDYGSQGPSNEKTVNACIKKSRIRNRTDFDMAWGCVAS